MKKKEVKGSEELIELATVNQERNVYKKRHAGIKVKTEKMDQVSKSVYRKMKFEDWRFKVSSREHHLKELKMLLSSDPVIKTIKPKLIGYLRGPISAPKPTQRSGDIPASY